MKTNKYNKYNILLILFILYILINSIYKIIIPKSINIDNSLYIEDLENKYNELLKLNNIDIYYNIDYLYSYILYKDIYNYKSVITISGSNYKVNDPVIYNNTLIGVISKVYKDTSIVRLLNNKDTLISVKINNEIGILKYKDNTLLVEDINNYANISIGDKVYTSGIGSILNNIYIGIVKDIKIDNLGIEKLIYIESPINIEDINCSIVLSGV